MAPWVWAASWWRGMILIGGLIMGGAEAFAQPREVKIVGNDRGGLVGARAVEITALNARGGRVELRGRICYSSCTMYLGADDVCILPETTFGFHGPSRHGAVLNPSQFEHWSQVMAAHYQPPLHDWFLTTARYDINRIFRISGAQLIALGYTPCDAY